MVDGLKRDFYGRLDALRSRQHAAFYSPRVRQLVQDIFPAVPSAGEIKHLRSYASGFVERHAPRLDRLIEELAKEINLGASTNDLDQLLATLGADRWPPDARAEVLVNYLGFPFWDVLTFPMTSARDMGEFNEILVDRISPQDVQALKGFSGVESLRGVGFAHFAAFLSRAYRENDYLLGRLHAAERLIDIVCDAAGADATHGRIDGALMKRRAFLRILDAEEPRLRESAELIAGLRRCVAEATA